METWNVYELGTTGKTLLAQISGQDARKATSAVYELSTTGKTLLVQVNGRDARKVANEFGREYMAEHKTRVCIVKANS